MNNLSFVYLHKTFLWLVYICRQNAELAKLRQECLHLNQKLNERTVAQHAEEDRRKALEAKMAATEEQLTHTKVKPSPLTSYLLSHLYEVVVVFVPRQF